MYQQGGVGMRLRKDILAGQRRVFLKVSRVVVTRVVQHVGKDEVGKDEVGKDHGEAEACKDEGAVK